MAGGRVVTFEVVRDAWHGARESWRDAAGDARRRFWVRYLVGTLVLAILSGASAYVLFADAPDRVLALDASLEPWIQTHMSLHRAVWIGAVGSSVVFFPLIAFIAIWAGRRRDWVRALSIIATYAACKTVTTAGWLAGSRDRPGDVVDGALAASELASYPSGHTVQGFAIWGLLVWWWTRRSGSVVEQVLAWSVYAVIILLVGAARVAVGAHHPTDVVAGVFFGLGVLAVMIRASRGATGD